MYILHYTPHFLFAIMFYMYILANPIFVSFVEQWSQGGISTSKCVNNSVN